MWIKIKTSEVARGHNQHRTGTGAHADKRLKRLKTRAAQKRQALKGQ